MVKMKFFLDTANLSEIKHYVECGVVDGVTTNPSLVAKEGVSMEKRVKEIAKVVNGPISVEVLATEVPGMLKQARAYAKWHKNVVVKLPMTCEGLKALKVLAKEKIKVNVTLIFSVGQAMLAAKAGATYVSPFIGRLDDNGEDGMILIEEMMQVFTNYGFATQVLVASIRHPRHVIEAAKLGADIATMPAEIMGKLLKHPMTDLGLEKFLKDWKNSHAKL